jgi:hypothetical protein
MMTEEKLRELFLATNTEEPLAGGWPGLLRYGMAVSVEAKREALLERADYYDSIPGYEAFGGTIADELREKAKELE